MINLQRMIARTSEDKTILRGLSKHPDRDVRYWVAANLSTPDDILLDIQYNDMSKRNCDCASRTRLTLFDMALLPPEDRIFK